MVYQWKSASRIKSDPQVAGAQFEQLANTVGLTPKTVLDANRADDAPLHSEFEWDDSIAAENYRVSQAGILIRAICVVPELTEVEKAQPIRAFFPTVESGGYESINVILQHEDKYNELLSRAYSELTAFIKKYDSLKELKPIRDAYESMGWNEYHTRS